MTTLAGELSTLDPALLERLEARGFRPELLLSWAASLGADPALRNRLPGLVEAVPRGSVASRRRSDELVALGRRALDEGRVAVCVLAGGMATRMGGVVKALVEALPGRTFLDLRLAEIAALEARGARVPLWLMTSEPTDGPIREALGGREHGRLAATFEQFVSLRLERSGALFRVDGEPSVHATGHGDLPDALVKSGLLEAFVARGGRHVWISNLDNLGASVDEAILGHHLASGAALTAEVVEKRAGDAGGGPVLHDGRVIIAENFRLPPSFDPSTVPVFNTNTFLVEAEALLRLAMPWTYLEVKKQVAGREAVQFERLLGELTMALDTHLLEVPRDGLASRFLPVKSHDDLAALASLLRERRLGERVVGASPTAR
ncbi:MAG: UTP--glucose-1-phosphate uridylyltransferase [Deltaproteobacteria bacterium]|nr:UTP--glucose-1-phosphate uridylyltransferase [Deltaproteobacteria bacterium]